MTREQSSQSKSDRLSARSLTAKAGSVATKQKMRPYDFLIHLLLNFAFFNRTSPTPGPSMHGDYGRAAAVAKTAGEILQN